jgi:hypothetical protein
MKNKSRALFVVVGLVSSLCLVGTAGAAQSPVSGGVVHACLKAKGKAQVRGALRVVPSAKGCKKKRGERAIAWNVSGPSGGSGGNGAPGGAGSRGPAGQDGATGVDGPVGQIDTALTLDSQAELIDALGDKVVELEGSVTDLGGALDDACTQLSTVTDRVDLRTALDDIGLTGVLATIGGVIDVPGLPGTGLGSFDC